ncbi:MAG: 2-C-methyl-D-erythritol 2,4-cyclodiphosphate synthase [Actinobacteria bacterium]|nr:2-C-methyl-D-erythritol 2,4-cyclodiphosphate synthase [Actinomycetota bacterium]
MRVGTGFDVHAFADDRSRPLVLAGIEIPGAPGLAGHSDADVVAHAFADALLGAAALGDLGSQFGVDDPALAGTSSLELLARVATQVAEVGWRISNLDCVVVAQRPPLATFRDAMRVRVATRLGLPHGDVSVKITSADRLGAVGRAEGIACLATCCLVRSGSDGAPPPV